MPYPEPCIRLIRQDDTAAFDVRMTSLKAELTELVERLDAHDSELKAAARGRLGSLFNPADYPTSLQGMFTIEWDFPNVEPPACLQQLSPDLCQQERQQVQDVSVAALCLVQAPKLPNVWGPPRFRPAARGGILRGGPFPFSQRWHRRDLFRLRLQGSNRFAGHPPGFSGLYRSRHLVGRGLCIAWIQARFAAVFEMP